MARDESIRSTVQYAQRPVGSERLWFDAIDRTSNIQYSDTPVEIHDVTPLIGKTTLDREGFEVHNLPSKTPSWDDEAAVERVYYKEVIELLKKVAGAKHAVVFDRTFRRIDPQRQQQGGLPSARGAAKGVHSDFTGPSAKVRLAGVLGEQVADHAGRFAIVNVWRPLVDVVYDVPLGVLDATTVEAGDLTSYDLIFPERTGQTLTVHHNPEHKWFYLPRQQRNCVWVFKQFDSDSSRAQFVPHSPFQDPDAPPLGSFSPRESIELRVFLFYDSTEEDVANLQMHKCSR